MKLESIIYDDTSDNLWEEAYEIVKDEWLEKNKLSRRDEDEFDEMDEDNYDEIDKEYTRLYNMYWEILSDELQPFFNDNICVLAYGEWSGDNVFQQNYTFTWTRSWNEILKLIKHGKENLIVYQGSDGELVFEVITITGGYPFIDKLFAVRKITKKGKNYLDENGWNDDDVLEDVFNSKTMSKTPNLGLMYP